MLWFFPFMAGLLLRQLSFSPLLIWTGIGMFAAVVVFHLITLPTEFNASNRAETVLASTGIVSTQQEADGGNGYWMQPRSPTWRPRGHPCCS
jgi:Zn-dependent membrane protease YugP